MKIKEKLFTWESTKAFVSSRKRFTNLKGYWNHVEYFSQMNSPLWDRIALELVLSLKYLVSQEWSFYPKARLRTIILEYVSLAHHTLIYSQPEEEETTPQNAGDVWYWQYCERGHLKAHYPL